MHYFRIQSIIFTAPAYLAGQLRKSATTSDPGRGGGRLGPDSADEILGSTPGVFVRTRGRWDFVGWGNVASAALVGEPPGYGVAQQEPAPDELLGVTASAQSVPAPALVYATPGPPPGHMTTTVQIVCSGCGASFNQGENHWCSDAGRPRQ